MPQNKKLPWFTTYPTSFNFGVQHTVLYLKITQYQLILYFFSPQKTFTPKKERLLDIAYVQVWRTKHAVINTVWYMELSRVREWYREGVLRRYNSAARRGVGAGVDIFPGDKCNFPSGQQANFWHSLLALPMGAQNHLIIQKIHAG